MPVVKRPDGVEIHWERSGDGTRLLLAHQSLWSYPQVYVDLVSDLSTDHCVVSYDLRGCGRSSRQAPYDPQTDAGDLLAVVEAAGGVELAVAVGDGLNRSARVAVARPDLVVNLLAVSPAAAAVLPRDQLRGSEGLAASESVIEMLLQMMSTDPRAALRTVLAAVNPELNDEELRDRVNRVSDYVSPEASLDRVRAWLEDDVSEQLQLLGDRLWIAHGGTEPLYEGELATRVAELFPGAHLDEVSGGPVSRPDLTAAHVRRIVRPSPGRKRPTRPA
jgi:pimeloyl-ACP methyl ester carboxylesterase